MRRFVYLITEGVLDVVFLTEIMRHRYSLAVVARKADLEIEAAKWLDHFKWPVGEDISRMAVPAPVFSTSGLLPFEMRAGSVRLPRKCAQMMKPFFAFHGNPLQ
jgi:hypothetical protein